MGKIIVYNQITVNGAFEAPSPEEWLELDADSGEANLQQLILADAMLLGRKTYEGLAAVWPHLGEDPTMGYFAERVNSMPKYVASRTLSGPLAWNATLIEGEVVQAVPALKEKHTGNLIVSGCGELAHTLAQEGLVDEFWFCVNPHLWPSGPRVFDGVGPIRLQLVSATPYRSGVVWLRYRPAGA
ncbi:deaminase [Phytoactinopolyspora alkaliphila]|uniref:Deaminase n=1 Tax=Phytoactinopolyspora alkaliphila TaxID=1783498 RepID=A0A6N9YRK6_9ACTN|nr:dihydrofolate reductase family protein [Phytoactinopolyspora alkaliphila]NED97696.1 deaminase [Phytoactinopolyspora alkaliphila]